GVSHRVVWSVTSVLLVPLLLLYLFRRSNVDIDVTNDRVVWRQSSLGMAFSEVWSCDDVLVLHHHVVQESRKGEVRLSALALHTPLGVWGALVMKSNLDIVTYLSTLPVGLQELYKGEGAPLRCRL